MSTRRNSLTSDKTAYLIVPSHEYVKFYIIVYIDLQTIRTGTNTPTSVISTKHVYWYNNSITGKLCEGTGLLDMSCYDTVVNLSLCF